MCSNDAKGLGAGTVKGGIACGVACASGLAAAILFIPMYSRIKRNIELEFSEAGCEAAAANIKATKQRALDRQEAYSKLTGAAKYASNCGACIMTTLDRDVHQPLEAADAPEVVKALDNQAEVFDPNAEAVFRYIQILTAIPSPTAPTTSPTPWAPSCLCLLASTSTRAL